MKKDYEVVEYHSVTEARMMCSNNKITLCPTNSGQCVAYTRAQSLSDVISVMLSDHITQEVVKSNRIFSIVIDLPLDEVKKLI